MGLFSFLYEWLLRSPDRPDEWRMLLRIDDEILWSLLSAILDERKIPYYVRNEVMNSLYPGLPLGAENMPTVWVSPKDWDDAQATLEDLRHDLEQRLELPLDEDDDEEAQ